jgi:hypothetical protein
MAAERKSKSLLDALLLHRRPLAHPPGLGIDKDSKGLSASTLSTPKRPLSLVRLGSDMAQNEAVICDEPSGVHPSAKRMIFKIAFDWRMCVDMVRPGFSQSGVRLPLHARATQTAIINAAQLMIDEVARPEDA